MGRRKKNKRRGRASLRGNGNNSPSNDLDRDDDFSMNGVEDNRRASSGLHRSRGGGYIRTNRKKSGGNPLQKCNLNKIRRRGSFHTAPNPSGDNHSPRAQRQRSPHGSKDRDTSPTYSPVIRTSPSPSRSSRPGGRQARPCAECSAVRRANLTLHDWFTTSIANASKALDNWSNKVGLSCRSGDEMDWQPEPVVRVLIVSTPSPSHILSPTNKNGDSTGSAWQQDPPNRALEDGGEGGGRGVTAVDYMTGSSPWGLRPGTLGVDLVSGNGDNNNTPSGGKVFAPEKTMTPPDTPPSLLTT
ncbi:hypothetical protein F5Y09DRAFT_299273 [Xylaria sp. FL1042]|nr:hypothetical protein F5Y09DRAFT_299273 [Xylaria sp. FL1042]